MGINSSADTFPVAGPDDLGRGVDLNPDFAEGLGRKKLQATAHDILGLGSEWLSEMFRQNSRTRRMSQVEISSLINDIMKLLEDNPGYETAQNNILAELHRLTGYSAGDVRNILGWFQEDGIIYTADVPNESKSAGTAIAGVPALSLSPR